MSIDSHILLLIIGPSGVGKGTTMNILAERHPDWVFPVSATTRPPRPGEKDGDIYHFFSHEEFEEKKEAGEFLEWAEVHGQHYYGTLKSEILPPLQEGKVVVREVDAQGFESLAKHPGIPREHLAAVFLLPPSEEFLIRRIKNRAPISDEELERRLESLKKEMEIAADCDYQVETKEGELELPANEIEKIVQKHVEKLGKDTA